MATPEHDEETLNDLEHRRECYDGRPSKRPRRGTHGNMGHSYGDITLHGSQTMHLGDVNHFHQASNVDLNLLWIVEDASFDAYGQVHRVCHPSTRVELLRGIQNWVQEPQGRNIFWLSGMAGTGKSTIATTVAQWLVDQRSSSSADLGASFFFKRGEGDRGSAKRFIPTIIKQLALKISGLDIILKNVLASYPDICNKALAEQFRTLLLEPLQKVTLSPERRFVFVIVVDALDECENENDIRILLRLWSSLPPVNILPLKLFVTSRPEWPIRLGFKKMGEDKYQDIILHEIPPPIIQHDIQVFLEYELDRIREEYNEESLSDTQLAPDWPGRGVVQKLIDAAVPLFIVAATICRFLAQDFTSPQEQLKKFFQLQATGSLSQMRQTYLPVLNQWKALTTADMDESRVCVDFQTIIGAIVTVAEPLSMRSLAILLNMPIEVVAARLKPMHAVLEIPNDSSLPVRPLHLSFVEFLSSRELQSQPFYVDPAITHSALLTDCLRLMSAEDGLRENLCDLPYPGFLRQDITSDHIRRQLSPAVQYACRYWVHHAQHSASRLKDYGPVHLFLEAHLLHWLEALCLLDRLAETIRHIEILKSILESQKADHLAAFLYDAYRFVLANRYAVDLAPLQLYSSSIIFAPRESVVRNVCGRIPGWIRKHSIAPQKWNSELQTLEGHSGPVWAVAFSHDGKMLASAAGDKTVKTWDPSTGQLLQTYRDHDNTVRALSFTPDDKHLMCVDRKLTITIRDPFTGQVIQQFFTNGVNTDVATFSHDCKLLATVVGNVDIWLSDTMTGEVMQRLSNPLEIKSDLTSIKGLAFSSDNMLLCGFNIGHASVWNLSTRRLVRELRSAGSSAAVAAFFRDDILITSDFQHGIISLWDVINGQMVQEFSQPNVSPHGMVVSSDGGLLAVFSIIVHVIDVGTGQTLDTLRGHSETVTGAVFSPSNGLLATGSLDETIRIWETSRFEAKKTIVGDPGRTMTDFAFLQDGTILAAICGDSYIEILDTSKNRTLCVVSEENMDYGCEIVFSSSRELFLLITGDGPIIIWNTFTGEAEHVLECHESYERAIFSDNEKMLITTSRNGTILIWDLATKQILFQIPMRESFDWPEDEDCYSNVALSGDGSLLAVTDSNKVLMYNLVSSLQTCVKDVSSTDTILCVAFSHDVKLLAIGLYDCVELWDHINGQVVQTINCIQHSGFINFTPDDTTLHTCSNAVAISSDRCSPAKSEAKAGSIIELKSDWIYQDGVRLLWVPQRYRVKRWIFHKNTLAVALDSGEVGMLQIDYPGPTKTEE